MIYEAFLSFENISENIILRKIILKIDQETRKKRRKRYSHYDEIWGVFPIMARKKILRTNFGLSFVIAMHRE